MDGAVVNNKVKKEYDIINSSSKITCSLLLLCQHNNLEKYLLVNAFFVVSKI